MSRFLKSMIFSPNSRLIFANNLFKAPIRNNANQAAQNLSEEPEADWFEKISNSDKNSSKTARGPDMVKFSEATKEEKREIAKQVWQRRKDRFESVPKVLTEEILSNLIECETHTQLNKRMM
jgi:hypothetical protein